MRPVAMATGGMLLGWAKSASQLTIPSTTQLSTPIMSNVRAVRGWESMWVSSVHHLKTHARRYFNSCSLGLRRVVAAVEFVGKPVVGSSIPLFGVQQAAIGFRR